MKLLKVIVRPDKLDPVRTAIQDAGVPGVTVTEVRGHGQQKGHTAIYRGQEYEVNLLPKMELEVLVADHLVSETTVGAMAAARTGQPGDGRIFVLPVERSYRIRTGEIDPL